MTQAVGFAALCRTKASLLLGAVGLVLPPLTVFAPLGVAPLLVVAGIATLTLDRRFDFARHATLIALLGSLGAWGTLSSLWSIIPAHSLLEGFRFLGESALGLIILDAAMRCDASERDHIARALLLGSAIALVLLGIERFGGEPILRWWHGLTPSDYEPLARYDRGVTVLVLQMPALAVARGNRWLRLALIAAIVAAAVLMTSTAALLAAAVGIAVFVFARFVPRLVAACMTGGVLFLAVAIPIATPSFERVVWLRQNVPWLKWSGIHRLLIWRFASDRVAERPFLGWGMDASRDIPGGKTNLTELLPGLHTDLGALALPLHPHNGLLQWLLELGIPGLALGLALIVLLLYRLGWRAPLPPHARAATLSLAAGALIVGMLSFGIWQAWWLSTLWLTCMLFAASTATSDIQTG